MSAPAQKCLPSPLKIITLRNFFPSESFKDEFLETLLSEVHEIREINSLISSLLRALNTSLRFKLIQAISSSITILHNLFFGKGSLIFIFLTITS